MKATCTDCQAYTHCDELGVCADCRRFLQALRVQIDRLKGAVR